MISQERIDLMQSLCGLARQANPADVSVEVIDQLIKELTLTREERKGFKIAAERLKEQNKSLLKEVMDLYVWKQNTIEALKSIDMNNSVSLWITKTGIEVGSPDDETKPSCAVDIETEWTV